MQGTCQKVETLSDGSVKLSIYVNQENIIEATQFAFKSVNIEIPSPDLDRSTMLLKVVSSLESIENAIKRVRDLIGDMAVPVISDILDEGNEELKNGMDSIPPES